MPMIQSSYPPGSSLTTSSGGGYGPTDYLQALLGREDQALRQQQVQRAPVQGYQPGVRMGASGNDAFQALAQRPQMQERQVDPREQHLRNLQMADQEAQIRARQQAAPMRVVGGAGVVPGYMMDTNAMNAYQRQAYLPNESGLAGGGLSDKQQLERAALESTANRQERERGEQRASSQTTNLPGAAQQAHDDDMARFKIQAEANARYRGGQR